MISPQVLSDGHGALHLHLETDVPVQALLKLLVLKAATSAISISSGFRGGLFFASVLMGALIGRLL